MRFAILLLAFLCTSVLGGKIRQLKTELGHKGKEDPAAAAAAPAAGAAAAAADPAAGKAAKAAADAKAAVDKAAAALKKPAAPTRAGAQDANLQGAINEADLMIAKLKSQLDLDTATATDWATVIENYQFKYSSLLNRIKTNQAKFDDISTLLNQLKGAKTHKDVESMLSAAQADLGAVAAMADPALGKKYDPLAGKLDGLKKELSGLGGEVEKVVANTPTAIAAVNNRLPPASSDLIKGLGNKELGDKQDGEPAAIAATKSGDAAAEGEEAKEGEAAAEGAEGAEGEAAPAEGEAAPAEGEAAPAEGEAAPAEGEAAPAAL